MAFIAQEKSKRFIVVIQSNGKVYVRNTNDKKWVELSIKQFTHGSDIIQLAIADLEKGIFTTYCSRETTSYRKDEKDEL